MTKKEWEEKVAELRAKDRSPKDDQELEALFAVRKFDEEPKKEKSEKNAASKKKSK